MILLALQTTIFWRLAVGQAAGHLGDDLTAGRDTVDGHRQGLPSLKAVTGDEWVESF